MAGTFTGKPLCQVALPNTAGITTHYTAPALGARITEVSFCNTDTVDRTVRCYFVPSGGAIGVANVQYYDFPIPSKASIAFGRNAWLAGAGFIQASADAAAVVGMTVSGMEET